MATATGRGGGSASDLETGVKIGALTGDDDMSDLRWAALAGAAMLNVNIAQAVEVTIQLPPLADAILNGNTDDLDPVLLEALSGDFTFALGIQHRLRLRRRQRRAGGGVHQRDRAQPGSGVRQRERPGGGLCRAGAHARHRLGRGTGERATRAGQPGLSAVERFDGGLVAAALLTGRAWSLNGAEIAHRDAVAAPKKPITGASGKSASVVNQHTIATMPIAARRVQPEALGARRRRAVAHEPGQHREQAEGGANTTCGGSRLIVRRRTD
jgi:hypothetical protein